MEEKWEKIALHRFSVRLATNFPLLLNLTQFSTRYLISDFEGGSLLRIEPVRKKKESGMYECVAENGNGDPVAVEAELTVYDGKLRCTFLIINKIIIEHI